MGVNLIFERSDMCITVVIANQKGGVAKSTTASNLAHSAQEKGLKVLLVDQDQQGSLTYSFPIDNLEMGQTAPLKSSHLHYDAGDNLSLGVVNKKISIIPADDKLLTVDKAENKVMFNMESQLDKYRSGFDLCIIDTPPSLGIRLMASLIAADYVLTPVSVGAYELSGVGDLLRTIHLVRTQGFNSTLKHLGILLTKVNSRSKEEAIAIDELRQSYGDAILPFVIHERAAVKKATARKVPVWHKVRGDGHAKAAKEWRDACTGILTKLEL